MTFVQHTSTQDKTTNKQRNSIMSKYGLEVTLREVRWEINCRLDLNRLDSIKYKQPNLLIY